MDNGVLRSTPINTNFLFFCRDRQSKQLKVGQKQEIHIITFDRLGLSAEILRAITDQKYSKPTPIQQQAIPIVLEGSDLLAGAQTGTGKTAGFTLPLLQILSQTTKSKRKIRGLVLTPTRELAAQVADSIKTYGKYLPLRSTVVFGGVNINHQVKTLHSGVDILVATPGRLLDHIRQGNVDMQHLEILVLDEADRMLDMGFIHDIKRILAFLPKQRQTLLFSATFSNEIKALANRMLNQPKSIQVTPRNTATEQVEQIVYPVERQRKRELLSHIIKQGEWHQVLVFTRTKHGANKLARQLDRGGLTSLAIHGNKSQTARTSALSNFKAGKVRVLVATDIAARGLDIDKLPHVVNFDLPNVPEDYVHRIGRTGRAGHNGQAVSLVSQEEHKLLRDIERVINKPIPKVTVGGFEPGKVDLNQSNISLKSKPKRTTRPPMRRSGNEAQATSRPPRKRSRASQKNRSQRSRTS